MLETIQILSPLALSALHWAFIIPICILSVFLTLLILVQRGRGGGLTGALGGMGGQSSSHEGRRLVHQDHDHHGHDLDSALMGALKVLHVGKFGTAVKPTAPTAPAVPGTNTVDPLNTKPGPGLTPETAPAKSGSGDTTPSAACSGGSAGHSCRKHRCSSPKCTRCSCSTGHTGKGRRREEVSTLAMDCRLVPAGWALLPSPCFVSCNP